METKLCRGCGWQRKVEHFAQQHYGANRYCYSSECRDCRRARDRARYAKDGQKKRDYMASYRQDNRESVAAYQRSYFDDRPGLNAHYVAARRAAVLQATPPWADMDAIAAVYADAAAQGLTVDHVVPLQGEFVCGLHVANNLQLMTAVANSAKGNRCVL